MKIFFLFTTLTVLISCNNKSAKPRSGNFESGLHKRSSYYTEGSLKDTIFEVEKNIFKYVSYFESGEVQQIGYYRDTSKTSFWRYYSRSGEILNTNYYTRGNTVSVKIDSSDFYFVESKIDDFFSLGLPKKWKSADRKGAEKIIYKEENNDPYNPNIIVIKDLTANLPNSKDSISYLISEMLNLKSSELKIVNSEWVKSNLLSVYYFTKNKDDIIGHLDFIFLDKKYSYMVYCSAYEGNHSGFQKYVDLFLEIRYSIKNNQ